MHEAKSGINEGKMNMTIEIHQVIYYSTWKLARVSRRMCGKEEKIMGKEEEEQKEEEEKEEAI